MPGSSTVAPRARSVARLACVAGCSYIASFIAGASDERAPARERGGGEQVVGLARRELGERVGRGRGDREDVGDVRELEVRERRVRRRGSPGNAPRSGSGSHSVMSTGAPVIAANDAVPTKRVDASVWITRTAWPAFVASRVSSSAL